MAGVRVLFWLFGCFVIAVFGVRVVTRVTITIVGVIIVTGWIADVHIYLCFTPLLKKTLMYCCYRLPSFISAVVVVVVYASVIRVRKRRLCTGVWKLCDLPLLFFRWTLFPPPDPRLRTAVGKARRAGSAGEGSGAQGVMAAPAPRRFDTWANLETTLSLSLSLSSFPALMCCILYLSP